MINLRLTPEDLINIIGFKEAQIYQLSKDIDAQNVVLVQLQNRVAELEQTRAELESCRQHYTESMLARAIDRVES